MTKQQEPSQSISGLSRALFVVVLILGVIWCTACVLGYINLLVAVGSIVAFGALVFVSTFVKDRGRFSLRSLLVVVLLVGIVLAFRSQCVAPYIEQEKAIAELRKLGRPILTASDGGPRWMRYVVGKDRFLSVKRVGNIPMGMEHPLRESELDDDDLRHCASLRGLERLILEKTQVTDNGLKWLQQMPSLRYLSLSQTRLTDEGTRHVADLTKLEALRTKDTQFGDATLKSISGLKNLRDVELGGSKMTDGGLRHLEGLSRLGELYIVGTKVSGKGLDYLQALPQLNKVCLLGAHVSNDGLSGVGCLRRVSELQLAGPSLDGDGVKHLQNMPNLVDLSVCTNATLGKSLSNVRKLRKLQSLSLDCELIDGAGLSQLTELSSLGRLFLRTNVRLETNDVEALKEALPETEIMCDSVDLEMGKSWHREELDDLFSTDVTASVL